MGTLLFLFLLNCSLVLANPQVDSILWEEGLVRNGGSSLKSTKIAPKPTGSVPKKSPHLDWMHDEVLTELNEKTVAAQKKPINKPATVTAKPTPSKKPVTKPPTKTTKLPTKTTKPPTPKILILKPEAAPHTRTKRQAIAPGVVRGVEHEGVEEFAHHLSEHHLTEHQLIQESQEFGHHGVIEQVGVDSEVQVRLARSSNEDPASSLPTFEEIVVDDEGDEGSGSEQFKDQESADHATVMKMEMPPAPAPPPPYTEKLSSGSHGIQGPRGERGEPGQPGVCMQQCRDGLPGSNGQQGPQGIQGPPGPPGAAGAPGAGGGYDESGMRSMPGPMGSPGLPGSQGPQGLQGPRGEAGLPGRDGRDYQGLTEEDIERIARHPSAKGEKGECEQQIVSAASASEGELPPYDSQRHRHTTKGEKGDRGDSGPSGPPGPQGPPGPAGFGVAGVSAGGVQVFPTTVELFAVARSAHIGTLAFATSSQQLYIKVNNGWKEVLLGAFHPVLQQRQSVPIVLDSDFPGQHLEYWEAPTTEKQMVPSPEYHRDTPIPPVAHPAPSQTETVIHQHKDKVIHMIALNKPLDGNMHGMRGADLLCYREARLAGFTTTFRAMLSSNVQDVLRIVHNVDMDTPIVNLRGERLYTSWRSLLNEGERTSAPIYSFNRKDILNDDSWPNKLVWHASKDGGVRAGEYCEGWRRNYDTRTAHAGDLRATGGLFADSVEMDCSQKLVVLCVENMSKYHGDKILRKKRPSDLVW